MDKSAFLKNELTRRLATIAVDNTPAWGKMNLQQMVEHLSRDAFRVASGKVSYSLMTPQVHIGRMQAFIESDKPFKENTVNRLMAEEPLPVVHADMQKALQELQSEIDFFFEVYEQQPGLTVVNPFFGKLDFGLQVQLLHKHAIHHLKQFGVEITDQNPV